MSLRTRLWARWTGAWALATAGPGRRWLLPLVGYALAHGVLFGAALAAGVDPRRPASWCQGDSGHYLSIAARGYVLEPCGASLGASLNDEPACGNVGWLPGYPLVVRVLRGLGIGVRPAALAVALLGGVAALRLLWSLALGPGGGPSRTPALGLLLAAAFFPGAFYQHAVFPVSLFMVLALLCLEALSRGRWLAAGVAGAGAAFTYSSGIFLVLVAGLWCLGGGASGRFWRRFGPALAIGGAIALGLCAALAWQRIAVGAWDGFFRLQAAYGHSLHNPVATWWGRVSRLLPPGGEARSVLPAAQTLLVTGWMLTLAAGGLHARGHLARMERVALVYSGVFWLLPLVLGAGLALHRAEALLLPSLILWRRVPRGILTAFALGSVGVSWGMGVLFFRSALL